MRHLNLPMLLAALLICADADAVDTSRWKCELCPFPDKTLRNATVDVGAIAVSDKAAKFGDYTGLNDKGPNPILDGSARFRTEDGKYGSVTGSDLGLDTRSLDAQLGQEGRYRLQLDYGQIPRHFYQGAVTPFLGIGGSVLSLPAGFPAGTTAQMPLESTEHPAHVGYKRSRLEAGLLWIFGPEWTTRFKATHDERDGTRRMAGSFFSTSSQLAVPRDEVTDQIEMSASRFGRHLQFTVGYLGSLFHNGQGSLTWTNPFPPIVPGATAGQLALPPDNQYHQLMASAGYDLSRKIHVSADAAVGRMTQNEDYLAISLNPTLASVPALTAISTTLPSASLHGLVYTFNGAARVSAAPTDRLSLNASYSLDTRDNRTDSLAYPAVTTDMFVGPLPRSNQPFSFVTDRLRLSADYSAPAHIRLSVGADGDYRGRTLQEVVNTREVTGWTRASTLVFDKLSVSLKYAHANRSSSTYGTATWIDPPENPLLRKYYLARRIRDSVGLRTDFPLGKRVTIGFGADWAQDDYNETSLGLLDGRSVNLNGDVSVALTQQTQLHAFGQGERTRSHQADSQLFARPDWWARIDDVVDVEGIGIRHLAKSNKFELSADYTRARSHTDTAVDAITVSVPFPENFTRLDTLQVRATYRVNKEFSMIGQYRYERYSAADWRYEDLLPDTVANLLVFGDQPSRYHVNVIGLALRYRF